MECSLHSSDRNRSRRKAVVARRPRWRTWILFGLVLLPGFTSLTSDDDPQDANNANLEDPSWLEEQWHIARDFYTEVAADLRWNHIPGLKMTPAKKHALWDEALRYTFLEDGWLGRPTREIPLSWNDDTYTPSVEGLSFRKVTDSYRQQQFEQYGQCDSVSLRSVDFGTRPTSVVVMLHRWVWLGRDRYSTNERGCNQDIWLGCKRSDGGWACEPVRREGTECNELAYDPRRWQELPGLTLTPSDWGS